MKEITVKKEQLMEKLTQNRADHRAIFMEALEGFQREAEAELTARLQDLRNGRRRDIYIRRPIPTDHTSDYDRAMAMIEMGMGDTVVLTEADFAQYVLDDWGWQGQFLSNTYGSGTATKKFSDRYVVE